MEIDKKIYDVDKVINDNFDLENVSRGFISQNVLAQLRNLVEYIICRIYLVRNNKDEDYNYYNISTAEDYVKTIGKYNFIGKYHSFLQMSTSHYTYDQYNSENLMLKYYSFLLDLKRFMKEEFDMTILQSLSKYPLKIDSQFLGYYKEIAKIIENIEVDNYDFSDERYYVQNIKPFYIDDEKYYEVTLTNALENASKFDRIITYTKINIMHNYSIKIISEKASITVLDNTIDIIVITGYEVAIRPCEINNLSIVLNSKINIDKNNNEYRGLMKLLTKSNMNLVELIDLSDEFYFKIKNEICEHVKVIRIFTLLDICRNICNNEKPGMNVIRYLLFTMNNKIIRNELGGECEILSNLFLEKGCKPFDTMPFYYVLKGHNPKIFNLIQCINLKDREHEFLAYCIKNNAEQKNILYNEKNLFLYENINELIEEYNDRLYITHKESIIEEYKNHIYIKSYVEQTANILKELIELSKKGIVEYKDSVNEWIDKNEITIDDDKRKILLNIFDKSSVGIIRGAAGTGKTTMMAYIANYFKNEKKLFLANTNTAVDNMQEKIKIKNSNFKTVKKILSSYDDKVCDVLFIDECSTISNRDMIKILKNISFKYLILVGDEMQIESIRFGNWFLLTKFFIPQHCIFELTIPYRARENKKLITLWDAVRNNKDNLLELLVSNKYISNLDKSILEKQLDDEVILCLNYDGLYGINNINRILQTSNPNPEFHLGIKIFKVGDPILFNETNRFEPVIHNNLKGVIKNIISNKENIIFDIEIKKKVTEIEASKSNLKLVGYEENGNSIIRISVKKQIDYDQDNDRLDMIVPFQVSYAISIHKSQGLEYDSVKIIIADDVYEKITRNIFYTAITRTRNNLKIYWSPETCDKILKSLDENDKKNIYKDVNLLSNQFNIKRYKK